MNKTLLFLLSVSTAICLNAQAPTIAWDNTIGGNDHDFLKSLQQTADGGYIIGGSSLSQGSSSPDKTEQNIGIGEDYWVVKLDASGTIVWDNTIGGTNTDELNSIQQTADGGYILAGYSFSNSSSDKTEDNFGASDYWVVKLDASGTVEWDNSLGGTDYDYLNSVQQTQDGGYILGGRSFSNSSSDKTENRIGGYDFWVVKLNASGVKEWDKTIGGTRSERLNSIQQTDDGGYILGGNSESNSSSDKTEDNIGENDYWVVKLNASGTIEWDNTIGGTDEDYLSEIQLTNDGGYILGGYSRSNSSGDKSENAIGSYDYWVVKLNASGTLEWDNTIGGTNDDFLSSIQQTSDGGYILGGSSDSDSSDDKSEDSIGNFAERDYWVVKLNATGDIVWDDTIGGTGGDFMSSIRETDDGGYIMGGSTESDSSDDKTEDGLGFIDYWVVKLSEGLSVEDNSINTLKIYPNPATKNVMIVNPINIIIDTAEIFDINGRLVKTIDLNQIQIEKSISLNSLESGVYVLKINSKNNGSTSRKLIKK